MSRRRDGARNFFPMPQKIFNLGMNAGEIAVYAYLMCRENRKTYQCYPSYRTIGDAVGMSRNTVKKYIDALVEKQLIYAEPTKGHHKGRCTQWESAVHHPPAGCGSGVPSGAADESVQPAVSEPAAGFNGVRCADAVGEGNTLQGS